MTNPKLPGNGQNKSAGSSTSTALAADGAEVLDDMAAFIRRYLVCDDHQLAILALWSASAYCHDHFFTVPYLHLRSAQPCSGKTLCLNLLCDLSDGDIVFSGFSAAALIARMIPGRSLDDLDMRGPLKPFPILIDDCHHSLSSSERQPLLSLLISGTERTSFFPWGDDDYYLFGPKALAGNAPLPKSLAARCIPIQLRPPRPSDKLARYWPNNLNEDVQPLRNRLRHWLQQASSVLAQASMELPQNLPPALSLGHSKCAEPLVHIADAVGGVWPAKIRAALVAVFDLAETSPELQMLSDVRAIFRDKDNPEYLATADLLSHLRTLDSRPWSAWTSKSGERLAGHLRSFGIKSRRLHHGSGGDFMGYLLQDFQDAWERCLLTSFARAESERVEVSSNGNENAAQQSIREA